MKKISLFTLFLALCFGIMSAQTYNVSVSGQVTDLANGSPVANHQVDIVLDSSNFLGFSYFGSVMTDVNGNYSDVIAVPGSIGSGTGFAGVRDCTPSGYIVNTFTYSTGSPNLTNVDFAICTTPSGSCQSDFSFQHVTGTTLVNFYDLSTYSSSIATWAWDFGDGATSSAQHPSHSYNGMGTYYVCLSIATTSGCTSTYCDTLNLGGSGINCQASLSASVSPAGVATFSTTASGTGFIVGYFYDFGDGNTLYSSSANEIHTYLVSGTYTACVYVDFNDSCRATACTNITITGGFACQASYNWYPDSSGAYSIIIVNTSIGNGLTYLWTFGDGSSSTQAYPYHQYSGPGTYQVCVTVTSANSSCTDTYCDTLVVVNKINAPFTINVIADGSTVVDPTDGASTEVTLYPNPARDFFQVELALDEAAQVKVNLLDLSGKLVATENAGNLGAGTQRLRIATQDLPAGMYLARVQAGDHVTTHKVMIAR